MDQSLAAVLVAQYVEDLLDESSSSSSSSSSSTSDCATAENIEETLCALPQEDHARHSGYLNVIEQYSDADFWRHFRVSRRTAEIIEKFLDSQRDAMFHGGWPPVSIKEMMFISLMYLANQGSLRLIADKFNRSESCVHKCIRFTTKVLSEKQNLFIKWPSLVELPSVSAAFQARAGFPGVVAALDGCHIRVHPPASSQRSYLNYKRFHSIILMAFVRPDRQFAYISVGFPGSNHDCYVLKRSLWWNAVESDATQFFPSLDYHVVADSAFPLTPFMLIPFQQNTTLSRKMKTFNRKLSSTRVVVEQAFGDLQNRFRRCTNIEGHIENCVDTVVASCVIHNMCIQAGDINLPEVVDVTVSLTASNNSDGGSSTVHHSDGVAKRHHLMNSM